MDRPVRPGDVLLGKYRVEHILGKGGMGVVVAARHLELGELFAVKFLLPEAVDDPHAAGRFVREARAAARLKSPHVVKVHDVGRLASGEPYMLMEYLNGTDLRTLVRSHGPLPIDEALSYTMQACEALAEAHAVGIIHRDVKSSNLFVTRAPDGTPWVKVLDFGISKQMGSDGARELTNTGAILGSPLFMSPEQLVRAKEVDGRTDIWSLGIVLYQLLTATTPFQSEALPEVLGRVLRDEAPPPSRHRAELPATLDTIVLRCLEKQPDKRFQTVGELVAALRAAQSATSASPALPPVVTSPRAAGCDAAVPIPDALVSNAALAASHDVAMDAAAPSLPTALGTHTASAWGSTGAGAHVLRSRRVAVLGMVVGMGVGGAGLWFAQHPRPIVAVAVAASGISKRSMNKNAQPAAAPVQPIAPQQPASVPSQVVATPAPVVSTTHTKLGQRLTRPPNPSAPAAAPTALAPPAPQAMPSTPAPPMQPSKHETMM